MAKVKDVISIMERYFPLYLAESWDNAGLQIGSKDKEVHKVAIALDLDTEVLKKAVKQEADMIITHHPLFFKGIKSIDYSKPDGSLIRDIIRQDISVYSAHTNLDAGEKGLNQILAEILGLQDIKPLDKGKQDELYKLAVYVPENYVNEVRQAINDAGAGNIGEYSDCSFRTRGIGAFKPGDNTQPFIGEKRRLEEVPEYRLETVLYKNSLNKVLTAMFAAHPYEEVAYDIYRLENEGKIYSLGRKGVLAAETSLADYAQEVKRCLNLDSVRVIGDLNRKVKRVAVVSGAGMSLLNKVVSQNIDLFITGDVKYHEANDAKALGLAVIDAGHQGTEEIVVKYLREMLDKESRKLQLKIEYIDIYAQNCIKNI